MYKKKEIALTFDDGPHPKYTPKILDILKEHDAKATFFLVGRRVRQNPDIVRRIFKEGHDIGNHTYSHPVSPVIRHRAIEKEIRLTGNIIKKIIGKSPRLFRPTWGKWDINSAKMMRMSEEAGYIPVRWSVSSIDWLGMRRVLEARILNNGMGFQEIILLHDGAESALIKNRTATVEVLPKILHCYQEHRFVKLSDLLTGGNLWQKRMV